MSGPRPEPAERLGPGAGWLFASRQAAWAVPLVVVAVSVSRGALSSGLSALVAVVAAVVAIVGVVVVPVVRVRRFRFAQRDEELELVHGALVELRTLVPVTRIQHVDVRRTAVSRALGLADLVVHTAAGTTVVPALADVRALEVRDRLADLAREPDEL